MGIHDLVSQNRFPHIFILSSIICSVRTSVTSAYHLPYHVVSKMFRPSLSYPQRNNNFFHVSGRGANNNGMIPNQNPYNIPPDGKRGYPSNHANSFYYYNPYGCYYGDYYPHQDNARKRQRRQTAGALMQNLFGGGGGGKQQNGKKKSTAQPRPEIVVPPRGIGPVIDPNDNDVLSGRGGRINAHKGNVQFRELVAQRKKDYLAKTTKKLEKAHIAADIVHYIRGLNPSGRFLKEDSDGSWWDIGDQKAIKKVGQALREDAPDIRGDVDPNDDADRSGEDDNDKKKESRPSPEKPKSKLSPVTTEQPTVRPGVAVSGRGAKIVNIGSPASQQEPQQHHQRSPASPHDGFHTLVYQEIAPPSNYQQIVPPAAPPQGQFISGMGSGMRGILPKSAPGVSGAAAAAMQQEQEDNFEIPNPRGDLAFGLPFVHPPSRLHGQHETSLVSGISNPSALSGVSSGISALTDPMSSLSETYQRQRREQLAHQMRQRESLNQLRQQWAQETHRVLPPTNSGTSSDYTATRQLMASAGLGSSLGRSNSLTDLKSSLLDGMSLTENSLVGGGMRESSMLSGLSAGMQSVLQIKDNREPSDILGDVEGMSLPSVGRSVGGGRGRGTQLMAQQQMPPNLPQQSQVAYQPQAYQGYHPPQQQQQQQQEQAGGNASVASMSVNSTSESYVSMRSIMSDLSANLDALDLAEHRLLDRT